MEVAVKWEGTVMEAGSGGGSVNGTVTEGGGSGGDSEMGRNSDGRRREWRWQCKWNSDGRREWRWQ